jgi:ubiquinone/menaquinone biosynthesis C-methylase UbiE
MNRDMPHKHLEELQAYWDGRADREMDREKALPMKQVHTDLIRREIQRCIGDEKGLDILEAGAGAGRFSIPLAKAGHRVVHLDISCRMLEFARESAGNLANIEFAQGSITDLSRFDDRSFDLVLCLDSPLSFCYDSYETALAELVRVCRSTLVLCVISRLGVITEGVNFDLKHYGRLRTVPTVYSTGTLLVTGDLRKLQASLMPSWHAFTLQEISSLLSTHGWKVARVSAPCALARFADPELLRKLFDDEKAYQDYLDFEEEYDSETHVLGMSSGAGGSLLVTSTHES